MKHERHSNLVTNKAPAFVLHLAQQHALCSSFVPTASDNRMFQLEQLLSYELTCHDLHRSTHPQQYLAQHYHTLVA